MYVFCVGYTGCDIRPIKGIDMVRLFSETPTLEVRALQIWQILIGLAYNRQTMTYGQVADVLGYEGAGVLGRQLGHIMHFCDQNDLPALTVLIVNCDTGLPGEGLETRKNLHEEREEVFKQDWFSIYPPSTSELANSWELAQNN